MKKFLIILSSLLLINFTLAGEICNVDNYFIAYQKFNGFDINAADYILNNTNNYYRSKFSYILGDNKITYTQCQKIKENIRDKNLLGPNETTVNCSSNQWNKNKETIIYYCQDRISERKVVTDNCNPFTSSLYFDIRQIPEFTSFNSYVGTQASTSYGDVIIVSSRSNSIFDINKTAIPQNDWYEIEASQDFLTLLRGGVRFDKPRFFMINLGSWSLTLGYDEKSTNILKIYTNMQDHEEGQPITGCLGGILSIPELINYGHLPYVNRFLEKSLWEYSEDLEKSANSDINQLNSDIEQVEKLEELGELKQKIKGIKKNVKSLKERIELTEEFIAMQDKLIGKSDLPKPLKDYLINTYLVESRDNLSVKIRKGKKLISSLEEEVENIKEGVDKKETKIFFEAIEKSREEAERSMTNKIILATLFISVSVALISAFLTKKSDRILDCIKSNLSPLFITFAFFGLTLAIFFFYKFTDETYLQISFIIYIISWVLLVCFLSYETYLQLFKRNKDEKFLDNIIRNKEAKIIYSQGHTKKKLINTKCDELKNIRGIGEKTVQRLQEEDLCKK